MKKVVFIIIALVMVVGITTATTREYFPNPDPHIIFDRPTSNYASNNELLSALHSEAEGTWAELTTEEKVWEMVKFVRRHALRGYSDKQKPTDQITQAALYQIFAECNANTYGYACEGFAHILTNLCYLESIEAYTISAGDYGGTDWTHSVTLVRILVDGHYRMVICDPYFGDMYYDTSGDPLSFFTMQDLITAEDYDLIYKVSIGYKYDIWSLSNTAYTGNFYSTDYIIETLVFQDETRKVWRTNNWFITPYCLETEERDGYPDWGGVYSNPYQLFNDVYDGRDYAYSSTNIATIEGRET